MGLELENLDELTREYMLAELEQDEVDGGRPYLSPRLSPDGAKLVTQVFFARQ